MSICLYEQSVLWHIFLCKINSYFKEINFLLVCLFAASNERNSLRCFYLQAQSGDLVEQKKMILLKINYWEVIPHIISQRMIYTRSTIA